MILSERFIIFILYQIVCVSQRCKEQWQLAAKCFQPWKIQHQMDLSIWLGSNWEKRVGESFDSRVSCNRSTCHDEMDFSSQSPSTAARQKMMEYLRLGVGGGRRFSTSSQMSDTFTWSRSTTLRAHLVHPWSSSLVWEVWCSEGADCVIRGLRSFC